MSLTLDDKKAIIAYRIQKSDQTMVEASDCAKMGHWSLAANRLYYALFHLASALLIDKGYTSKTHNGIICIDIRLSFNKRLSNNLPISSETPNFASL